MRMNQFIGKSQLAAIGSACRGEEGKHFLDMMAKLQINIATMPKSYETDGQGDEAIAKLHYFNSGSDWYITEKDAGSPDDEDQGAQEQAFGFACLNGDTENAELGYISIEELIKHGVELDLYYTPKIIRDIKKNLTT